MEFHELQQIVESNSRTIQAILEAQERERLRNEEYRREAAEERAELREATLRLGGVAEGLTNLLSSLDSDRPTFSESSTLLRIRLTGCWNEIMVIAVNRRLECVRAL